MATQVTQIPRLCSDCQQALFGPGGVYCREFHEDILDEKVAVDCGAFVAALDNQWVNEDDQWVNLQGRSTIAIVPADPSRMSDQWAKDHPLTAILVGQATPSVVELRPTTPVVVQDLERDQYLEGTLVVTFFGRTAQGHQLADEVVATLRLHYPTSTVTWDYPKEETHATPSV